MKKIIDNKIYDTDKCDVILEYQTKMPITYLGLIVYPYLHAKILKTQKGTYLKYIGKCASYNFDDLNEIEIVSKQDVKNLMLEISAVDEYEKVFGKLEEG